MFIRICTLLVQAGPPPEPVIEEITNDSVTLAWQKPVDDGGGKIEGYIVEMKPQNGDWAEATPVPIKDTTLKIPHLKEGENYVFRVKAVNAAGPGHPSRNTDMVKVETQPGTDIHI